MKRLERPEFAPLDVLAACATAVPAAATAIDIDRVVEAYEAGVVSYEHHAASHTLFQLTPCLRGQPDQIVIDPLTKGMFSELYDTGMVSKSPGRRFYDKILAIAPLAKCPYCGLGRVESLDHVTPKSRYPLFSVLPANLVPACASCNKSKSGSAISTDNQLPHPYFEDARVEQERWLYAAITESDPVTFEYRVEAPVDWPGDLRRRVNALFVEVDLARRYSVEAASDLQSISGYLRTLPDADRRRQHLTTMATVEVNIFVNGWKSAMYAALSLSQWYWEEGFARTGGA